VEGEGLLEEFDVKAAFEVRARALCMMLCMRALQIAFLIENRNQESGLRVRGGSCDGFVSRLQS